MDWIDPVSLANQIGSLRGARLVEFGTALLSEAAAQHGFRSSLSINLNIEEGDEGIDARALNIPTPQGVLFPRPNVDYQFKGGNGKSPKDLVDRDILRLRGVTEGLKNGHAFVYIATWDRAESFDATVLSELRKAGMTVDNDQFKFVGKSMLANLLQQFTPLVARFLRIDLRMQSLEEWASDPRLQNLFFSDERVDRELDELRKQVEATGSRVRVVGAAGHGKTRLVLEALRTSSLASTVLYAQQVEDVTMSFISHLNHTPDSRCTLVVDEVSDEDVEELTRRFVNMPRDVRLVMIGIDATATTQQNMLKVQGLSEDVLIRAIRGVVSGIPDEIARSIARDCENSPKAALLIARRIQENPGLINSVNFLADDVVWNSFLHRYLDLDRGSDAWKALSTASLLMRLGWTDEVEYESTSLFKAVRLDPTEARRHIQDSHRTYGIAPLAGHFRYISPKILADYLASRQIEAWTKEYLAAVFQAFTPGMADSFTQRLRRLSPRLENRRMIEEVLLGDQSPFRTLADLETEETSSILHRLAGPFPNATLNALVRIIEPASIEELRAATKSRRDLVRALEQLLWRDDAFETAVLLLFRLAIAENESWANNATGIFVETFQMVLGRTEAGVFKRARVLRRAASDADPAARILAAQAIGGAFRFDHILRGGMPPTDVEGIPTEAWRPHTYVEWSEAIVTYLAVLAPLLTDPSYVVKRAAANSLAEGLDAAFRLPPPAFSRWSEVAETLVGTEYSLREPLLDRIDLVLDSWSQRLADDKGENSPDVEEEHSENRIALEHSIIIRERLN